MEEGGSLYLVPGCGVDRRHAWAEAVLGVGVEIDHEEDEAGRVEEEEDEAVQGKSHQ